MKGKLEKAKTTKEMSGRITASVEHVFNDGKMIIESYQKLFTFDSITSSFNDR